MDHREPKIALRQCQGATSTPYPYIAMQAIFVKWTKGWWTWLWPAGFYLKTPSNAFEPGVDWFHGVGITLHRHTHWKGKVSHVTHFLSNLSHSVHVVTHYYSSQCVATWQNDSYFAKMSQMAHLGFSVKLAWHETIQFLFWWRYNEIHPAVMLLVKCTLIIPSFEIRSSGAPSQTRLWLNWKLYGNPCQSVRQNYKSFLERVKNR